MECVPQQLLHLNVRMSKEGRHSNSLLFIFAVIFYWLIVFHCLLFSHPAKNSATRISKYQWKKIKLVKNFWDRFWDFLYKNTAYFTF